MLFRLEYKWLVAITFVSGLVMQILDLTILNVALADLGRQFDAGAGTLQWVLTGYMASLAVFIPASGWVSDRFGTKRTFGTAIVLFTGASVLCGLSTTLGMLIGARVLQGVGGGLLVPVGQAMLFRAFPAEERAKASATLVIPISVAPALGPVLGGFLVDTLSWRWIFFINVPVGIVAMLCTVLFLREERQHAPGRFDFPGFLLAGVGLAGLLIGLDQGSQRGWSDPLTLSTVVVGVLAVLALVRRELGVREPMLDLRLLGNRMFATGNADLLCVTGAMFGVIFLTPLYLQQLRGATALEAGVVLMPGAFGVILTTQIASRIYGRVGPRRMIATGLLGLGAVIVGLSQLSLQTPFWVVAALLVGQGLSMGFAMVPMQTATFARIGHSSMGRATSMFNASRQIATASGVAVLATVLVSLRPAATAGSADPRQVLGAFHGAYLAALGFVVLGLIVTFFIRDSDAAPTMRSARKEPGRAAELVE